MPSGDNNRKLTDAQRREIADLYRTPLPDGTWMGCPAIAHMYGVTDTLIQFVLREQGVSMRNSRDAHANGKRCKPITNLPSTDQAVPLCKCGCEKQVEWNQRKNRYNLYVQGHFRPNGPHRDPNWLRQQYIDEHKTIKEIASASGLTITAIIYFMRQHGITRRNAVMSHIGTQVGENNPAWKGGITPERQRLYKSGEWINLVKVLYKRDKYTCCRCGSPKKGSRGLHAHHVKSWAEHPDLRFDLGNMLTLCKKCHAWVHSKANIKRECLS